MLRPESALNPRALRRETIQLGAVAAVSLVTAVLDVRALQVIAGIVDVLVVLITGLAAVVAWRVGGRGYAVWLYAGAVVAFATLAFVNLF